MLHDIMQISKGVVKAMATINRNYLKLPGSYLFSTIAKKVAAYSAEHPEADIIRLGIGQILQRQEKSACCHIRVNEYPRPDVIPLWTVQSRKHYSQHDNIRPCDRRTDLFPWRFDGC